MSAPRAVTHPPCPPAHPDDEPERPRPSGGYAGERVLEYRRFGRLHAERSRRGQERVRRRLATRCSARPRSRRSAPRTGLDAGRGQDVAAVRTRRDDRAAQSGVASSAHIADRALVRLTPVVRISEDELVLAIAQPADRLRLRLGRRVTLPEDRSPRLRNERTPSQRCFPQRTLRSRRRSNGTNARRPARPRPKEAVEHLLPGVGMHRAVSVSTPSRSNKQARIVLGNCEMWITSTRCEP